MHYYVVHVTWLLLQRGTLKGIHPEHEVMAMIIKSYKNSFSQQCEMMPWKDTIWAVPFRQYSTQNNSIWPCPCSIKFGTQANTFNTRGYLPKLTLPQRYMLCIYFIINFRFAESLFLVFCLLSNIQTLCEPAPQPACMTIKQESKIPLVHTCFKTHTSLSMQPFSTWFPSLRSWFCSG